VFTDLFPVRTIIKNKEFTQMFSALIIGALIMVGISSILGHSHEHEDGHNHDHGHSHDHEEHLHSEHDHA